MPPRLLIVDDDPQITSALARGLALHGYEAVTENRYDSALEQITRPELSGAIVDVMLGEDSGLDLVREARARGALLPVLMLSALSEVNDRTAGLEAGADDYVVKPFSLDELVARLRVQERRSLALRPEPAQLSVTTRRLSCAEGTVELTDRETTLLLFLVDRGGEPITRGALFDALWVKEGSSNENVVDVYIGYLRKKLSRCDFGFSIKTVRQKGFCLEGLAPKLLDP